MSFFGAARAALLGKKRLVRSAGTGVSRAGSSGSGSSAFVVVALIGVIVGAWLPGQLASAKSE